MTTTAVLVMVVSLLVVWGGLGLSIWRLRRDSQADSRVDGLADTQAGSRADTGPSQQGGAGRP